MATADSRAVLRSLMPLVSAILGLFVCLPHEGFADTFVNPPTRSAPPEPMPAALALDDTVPLGPISQPDGLTTIASPALATSDRRMADDLFRKVQQRSGSTSTFRLRGRIDVDAIAPFQSPSNQATFGDLKETVGFRRARIGAEGNFTSGGRYVAEIDAASGTVVLRDFYAGFGKVQGAGEFKIGHMREPFSLEGGTSANSFAFAERSLINSLDPARNWGVGFIRCNSDEDSTLAAGLFQSGTDASDVQFHNGSESALTGRWTKLMWYEDRGSRLMHVGLAISERIADYGIVTVNQRPNSPLLELGDSSESPFVPKITIPASFQQLMNAQWAFADGPLWAQAELYGTVIDQHGGPPIFYHGGHADLGYFLTGEHRNYLTQAGVFGPVIVKHPLLSGFSSHPHSEDLGYGAWEVTSRLSYLDFLNSNTPAGTQGQAVGTLLPQATIGVNWYLADRLRLMFNYSYVAPYEASTGWSSASVLSLRLGMFW